MNYYVVDAFTSQPFGGNPAGVVLLDGNNYPEEELMLKIAAELRYSETAFVRHDGEKELPFVTSHRKPRWSCAATPPQLGVEC